MIQIDTNTSFLSHHTSARRSQWQARAQRRIESQPGNASDRAAVLKRNERITAAYAEMYLRRPQVYRWAGMAALTSAAVGRGMYMMRCLGLSHMAGLLGLFGREVAAITQTLGAGNLAVFNDIYWQHVAYEHAGIAEIGRFYRDGQIAPFVFHAWQQIDTGRRAGDAALIWEGNRGLLRYEQEQVLQPAVYDGCEATWKSVSGWIMSPIPGHVETIEQFDPRANIGVFADRWRWIERRMLPAWQRLAERQSERVEGLLQVRMVGGAPFRLPVLLLGQQRYCRLQLADQFASRM